MKVIGRVFLAFVLIFTVLFTADAQTSGKKKYVPPASKTTPIEEEEEKQSPGTKPANKPEEKEESKSRLGFGVNLGNIAFAGRPTVESFKGIVRFRRGK